MKETYNQPNPEYKNFTGKMTQFLQQINDMEGKKVGEGEEKKLLHIKVFGPCWNPGLNKPTIK